MGQNKYTCSFTSTPYCDVARNVETRNCVLLLLVKCHCAER